MPETSTKQRLPVRPGAKLRAVDRVLRGEHVEDVAASVGVPVELVTKWHKEFYSAGKAALRYTNDPGEIPTIVGLQKSAQKAFPARQLHGCSSAACFFCAQFYGKNDIIHLYNVGLPDVTLIDLDSEKLAVMREIYPAQWTALVGEAFETAQRWGEKGRRFDVVICDPYTNLAPVVAWDHAATFMRIAGRLWMTLYTQSMFDELGVEAAPDSAGPAIAERTGQPMKLLDVVKRSTYTGGIYWCLFAAR